MTHNLLVGFKRAKASIVPLCFTAEEANSSMRINKVGNPTAVELEISTDGSNWADHTIGDSIILANVGDKVYMRNKSKIDTGFSIDAMNLYNFIMTGKIGASGDITSLLNKNGTNTLTKSCYTSLFNGCTSLTTAPLLPATELADNCYNHMFRGCASLREAPNLPATTLTRSCYYYMFYGCTSITATPKLSATTLTDLCYDSMFEGCTSLITLPELQATTLTNSCYIAMFKGCTNIKLSETQTGEYQIPYRIPTNGTGTITTGSLVNMFTDTGGTFTGTPTINTTYYTSNTLI